MSKTLSKINKQNKCGQTIVLFWVKHCRQIIVIYIRSLWTVLLTFVRRSWQKRYSYVGWKSSWDLIFGWVSRTRRPSLAKQAYPFLQKLKFTPVNMVRLFSYAWWLTVVNTLLTYTSRVAWLGSRCGKLVPDRYRHQISDSTILHLTEPIWPDWPSYWPLKNCQTKRLNNFSVFSKNSPNKSASPYGVAGGYRQIFIWYFQKIAQKSASPYGVAGGYRQKSILTFFSCSREFCPFEKELRLNTLFLISNVRIRAIVSAKGRKPVEKVCQLIFHCLKTLKTKITCNWCIYIKMC